jgi:hypothetical protein
VSKDFLPEHPFSHGSAEASATNRLDKFGLPEYFVALDAFH